MNPSASTPEDPTTDRPPRLPSEGVRTTISFLLFLHLFAVAVAVASNAGPVSRLREDLRRVPFIGPYLQLLHMDLGYNFHLTHATEMDTDHFIEIELNHRGDSDTEATRFTLPEPAMWPRVRRRRFQTLALAMAGEVGNDALESLLPDAVARGMLAGHGVTEGTHRFRCRRHYLLEISDVASADSAERDPFHPRRYATVYEADVKFHEGELLLTKAAAAAETAPVRRGE